MKAIAQDEFGPPDVLDLREIEEPTVDAHEVLVRVRAASPNPWDWRFMRGFPYISRPQAGWRKPKNEVLGGDVAGHVEAVGKDVTRFRPGNEVFGFVGHGAFAEYVSTREDVLALKPAGVSFEQAATTPLAGMTAVQGLRDRGGLAAGERVLIVWCVELELPDGFQEKKLEEWTNRVARQRLRTLVSRGLDKTLAKRGSRPLSAER